MADSIETVIRTSADREFMPHKGLDAQGSKKELFLGEFTRDD
jgi:hypothetical protein